jgi:ABC-type molybdate transport system permease subunit
MSPRYYLASGVIVFILTIAISWWKEAKSSKEVLVVFCQVVLLLVLLVGVVIGFSELLLYLGIAQSGFIVKQGELK